MAPPAAHAGSAPTLLSVCGAWIREKHESVVLCKYTLAGETMVVEIVWPQSESGKLAHDLEGTNKVFRSERCGERMLLTSSK